MRKTVEVDEMIKVARNEMNIANRYLKEGKFELYKRTLIRANAMRNMISITAIDKDKWDEEWNELFERVNG